MATENASAEILRKGTILVDRLVQIAKTPRDFGTGVLLYASELHIIEAVGKNPGINVTELANALGISKPAVSKFVKKLEQKRLIKRYREKGNEREVFFSLPAKGREVFDAHRKFHSRTDADLVRIIQGMSEEERRVIERFIDRIEVYVSRLENGEGDA